MTFDSQRNQGARPGPDLLIRPAGVAEVRPLQQSVLRPDGPLPSDRPTPAGWLHLAAELRGRIVGAASLGPASWPRPDLADLPQPTWQLRSMAVHPSRRGGGIGTALVEAAVAAAERQSAASLWAEARVQALPLYGRTGWRIVGPRWDKPGVGPHRYVVRLLTRNRRTRPSVG